MIKQWLNDFREKRKYKKYFLKENYVYFLNFRKNKIANKIDPFINLIWIIGIFYKIILIFIDISLIAFVFQFYLFKDKETGRILLWFLSGSFIFIILGYLSYNFYHYKEVKNKFYSLFKQNHCLLKEYNKYFVFINEKINFNYELKNMKWEKIIIFIICSIFYLTFLICLIFL